MFHGGINLSCEYSQDLNHYNETNNCYYSNSYNQDEKLKNFSSGLMLAPLDSPNLTTMKEKTYDSDVIKEGHNWIEGINEDFLLGNDVSNTGVKNEKNPDGSYLYPEEIKYTSFCDEFRENDIEDSSPEWYEKLVCTHFGC